MKTRQSGMPDEPLWESLFDPPAVLQQLGLTPETGVVVEFGCGYGTFTLPAAQVARGPVYAIDIDPEMIACVRRKAEAAAIGNIVPLLRDFVTQGTGLRDAEADYAMLLNILHAECPEVLLREAARILRPAGVLAIMHWNYDATTPRGPSMDIRPRPEQCRAWAEQAGFQLLPPGLIDLPPYHYGMVLRR